MSLSIIACLANNKCIGKNNKIPWHLKSDLKRFRILTNNKFVVMGRKTYESLPTPLVDRFKIVLSRDLSFADRAKNIHDVIVVKTKEEALKYLPQGEESFIIGGEDTYKLFMPFVDKMYLSILKADYEGDTFFPDYLPEYWKVIRQEQIIDDVQEYEYLELEFINSN